VRCSPSWRIGGRQTFHLLFAGEPLWPRAIWPSEPRALYRSSVWGQQRSRPGHEQRRRAGCTQGAVGEGPGPCWCGTSTRSMVYGRGYLLLLPPPHRVHRPPHPPGYAGHPPYYTPSAGYWALGAVWAGCRAAGGVSTVLIRWHSRGTVSGTIYMVLAKVCRSGWRVRILLIPGVWKRWHSC